MLLVVLSAMPLGAAPTVTVTDVPTSRSGIRIATYRPDVPLANLVVLPGGTGVFGLRTDGRGSADYFNTQTVSRNRDALVAAGISVVLVDTPLDMPDGISIQYRSTDAHMAEVREVLRAVRARDNLPTWVIGGSLGAIDAAVIALGEPSSTPFGLILVSPYESVLSMNLGALRRPTLLLTHQQDSCIGTPPENAPRIMERLPSGTPSRHVQYTGGSPGSFGGGCDSTAYHGLGGLDTEFVAEITSWMRLHASLVQAANYQGLWWRSPAGQENGWGVNITHQGQILFATWFTYDTDGTGMWLVMPTSTRSGDSYSGELYRTTGPAFSLSPWAGNVTATAMGTATFTFTDSNNGTFAYVVNGISQSKPITKQAYAIVPSCVAGAPHTAAPNYQALWWASPPGSENGWGVNIAHQGDILFATWFTYAASGRGQWLVMPNGVRTAAGTYAGALYRTTGPAFNVTPWAGNVTATEVGTGTFTFSGPDAGTFAYTVEGVSQSKAITRQVYGTPVTVCR